MSSEDVCSKLVCIPNQCTQLISHPNVLLFIFALINLSFYCGNRTGQTDNKLPQFSRRIVCHAASFLVSVFSLATG